jgi:hypothetical protein
MAWWMTAIAAVALLLALQFLMSLILISAIQRFAAAFVLAGCTLLIGLLLHRATLTEAWAALAWFVFFSGLYIFGFTLSQGSISIKMLQLLRSGPLARSDVAAIYSPEYMVEKRFDRLLAARFVVRDGDGLKLSARGRMLLDVFTTIQRFCHGRAGY